MTASAVLAKVTTLTPGYRRGLLWACALPLLLYFIAQGVDVGRNYAETFKQAYETSRSGGVYVWDFSTFYAGSKNIVSDDRADTYDIDTMVHTILAVQRLETEEAEGSERLKWLRYYNPPFFLLALSPLTLLPFHDAYLVALGVNFALMYVLALFIGQVLRWRQPVSLLVIAALLGFQPMYSALHGTQPTILLSVLFSAAFLATESGRRVLASVLIALMGMKPQWVVAPGLALLRHDPKAIVPLIAAGTLILIVPFAAVGFGGFIDYVAVVAGRGQGDLVDNSFSEALLSWAGFLRALTGTPQPAATLVAGALTLALTAIVFVRGDRHLIWVAGAMATVIAVPHSHPQEWVVVAPAAAILFARPTRPVLAIAGGLLLLAVYFGANDWAAVRGGLRGDGTSVYWVTLAGFAVLLWCLALPWIEAWMDKATEGRKRAILVRQDAPA